MPKEFLGTTRLGSTSAPRIPRIVFGPPNSVQVCLSILGLLHRGQLMYRLAQRSCGLLVGVVLGLILALPAVGGVGHESYKKWLPLPEGAWDDGSWGDDDHAVVLYKGHILDDSSMKGNGKHYVYNRVLVRDATGVEAHATVEISYANGANLDGLAARTVKPDGTVLQLDKVDFHEKTLVEYGKAKLRSRSFAFKSVDPGDIVEYRYVLESKMDAPPLVFLSSREPTRLAEVTWFPRTLPELDPRSKWEYAQYLWVPVYTVGNGRPYITREESFPDPEKPEGLFLALENLPAIARESYAPSFGERATTFVAHYQYPNRDEEADYWNRVAANLGEEQNEFGRKSSALDPWVREMEGQARDLNADLELCFQFIDSHVRCDQFLPVRERERDVRYQSSVNDLLEQKTAVPFDIDRLLVVMLDRLGYEATVFWLRDRTESPFVREWKSADQLTYTGVAVKDGDTIRWCYPAAGRGAPSALPWEFLGCPALLGRRAPEGEPDPFPTFEVIPIPEANMNRLDLTLTLSPDDDLIARGHLRHEWNCANEVHWVTELASLDEKERVERMRSLILPEGVNWKGHDEVCEVSGMTVAFACSLEVEGIVDEAGDLRLLDLSRIRADDFDVDSEDRQSDLEFRFPAHSRTLVDVHYPPQFTLETAPPSERVEESFARASTQSMRGDSVYRLVRDFEIPHCLFIREAAQPMHDFIERTYAATRNPLVLAPRPAEAP